MKIKNIVNLHSVNMMLIFGTTIVGLLALEPSQMVWASYVEGPSNPNSNQAGAGGCTPSSCQEAVNHINEAHSAMQNGDSEGAQRHLDLAKESLLRACPDCIGK